MIKSDFGCLNKKIKMMNELKYTSKSTSCKGTASTALIFNDESGFIIANPPETN